MSPCQQQVLSQNWANSVKQLHESIRLIISGKFNYIYL